MKRYHKKKKKEKLKGKFRIGESLFLSKKKSSRGAKEGSKCFVTKGNYILNLLGIDIEVIDIEWNRSTIELKDLAGNQPNGAYSAIHFERE